MSIFTKAARIYTGKISSLMLRLTSASNPFKNICLVFKIDLTTASRGKMASLIQRLP